MSEKGAWVALSGPGVDASSTLIELNNYSSIFVIIYSEIGEDIGNILGKKYHRLYHMDEIFISEYKSELILTKGEIATLRDISLVVIMCWKLRGLLTVANYYCLLLSFSNLVKIFGRWWEAISKVLFLFVIICLNPLPDDKILDWSKVLDWSKLKQIAYDILKCM